MTLIFPYNMSPETSYDFTTSHVRGGPSTQRKGASLPLKTKKGPKVSTQGDLAKFPPGATLTAYSLAYIPP